MDFIETGGNSSALKAGRFSSMDRNYNNDSAINLPAINNPYGGGMNIRTLRNEGRHNNNTITMAPN